jgi:hypothetical protein
MARRITITLGKARAVAELLEDDAPKTCDLIWNMLPLEGITGHSIDSGKEVLMNLDREPGFFPENQTIHELPGDVIFYYKPTVPPPATLPKPVISFIYDRDTQIRSLHGTVPVNLFAHIVEGLEQLANEAVRMKKEGYEPMRIARA